MSTMKKRLSKVEEFEVMKLVLDKFLLLGVAIMGYGLFRLVSTSDFWMGFSIMIAGGIVLLIFMILLIREYEFMN
jgi:hypothetical protein